MAEQATLKVRLCASNTLAVAVQHHWNERG